MSNFYERFARPLLFSLNPETAHHLAITFLRGVSELNLPLAGLAASNSIAKPTKLFGLTFPNPLGLAAGFDKNGVALPALAAMGFGFVEIGTVTAKSQPGNPRPRIFRFPEQRALVNSLGFNNDGADAVAAQLRRLRKRGRWPAIPIGINIGKSKATPLEEAEEDYLHSFRLLAEFADYVVLNVSSPNTPGLRELQGREALSRLLKAIQSENRNAGKPLLVKVAPDLSLVELEEIIAECEGHGVAGIVATNTTLDHSAIPRDQDRAGGLSGAPLREKSTALVGCLAARTKIPIVAAGGIFDAESAREKLEAGARLLQVYTGFIYRGPRLVHEICSGIGKT